MVSFCPGPSRVCPQLENFFSDAFASGILSLSHRSPEFVAVSEKTCCLLREKLQIPKTYRIFFTSSATECWEVIAESFIDLYSFHLYNGAFGERWLQYRKKIMPNASGIQFHYNRALGKNRFPELQQAEGLCITQNETSNGTQIKVPILKTLRKHFGRALIFVDATSSMSGITLPWEIADIWFASVQKCFGLPAGLALMICSPQAVEKAHQLNHRKHYNSLVFMEEKMREYQTTHTPNVLNIFLLMKVMESCQDITNIDRLTKYRAKEWYRFLISNNYQLLIENKRLRSDTVITVKGKSDFICNIKVMAREKGIILGNGYGQWKDNTFRIANFPAISDEEIHQLKDFLIEVRL